MCGSSCQARSCRMRRLGSGRFVGNAEPHPGASPPVYPGHRGLGLVFYPCPPDLADLITVKPLTHAHPGRQHAGWRGPHCTSRAAGRMIVPCASQTRWRGGVGCFTSGLPLLLFLAHEPIDLQWAWGSVDLRLGDRRPPCRLFVKSCEIGCSCLRRNGWCHSSAHPDSPLLPMPRGEPMTCAKGTLKGAEMGTAGRTCTVGTGMKRVVPARFPTYN